MGAGLLSDQNQFSDVSYSIAGWHAVRLTWGDIGVLRKQPPALTTRSGRPPSLKHSDEQTVAAFAAMCGAIQGCELENVDFGPWGILSSSRMIGRCIVTGTIEKYAKDGAWGVSMQITPHNMLHSISSTLSLALQCHGPCIGVGGGPLDEPDTLFAAVGLLQRPYLDGVWLTFSGWESEPVLNSSGEPITDGHCVAVALAVQRGAPAQHQSGLHIRRRAGNRHETSASPRETGSLFAELTKAAQSLLADVSAITDLGGNLQLELELRRPRLKTTHSPSALHVAEPAAHAPHFAAGVLPLAASHATNSANT